MAIEDRVVSASRSRSPIPGACPAASGTSLAASATSWTVAPSGANGPADGRSRERVEKGGACEARIQDGEVRGGGQQHGGRACRLAQREVDRPLSTFGQAVMQPVAEVAQ